MPPPLTNPVSDAENQRAQRLKATRYHGPNLCVIPYQLHSMDIYFLQIHVEHSFLNMGKYFKHLKHEVRHIYILLLQYVRVQSWMDFFHPSINDIGGRWMRFLISSSLQ